MTVYIYIEKSDWSIVYQRSTYMNGHVYSNNSDQTVLKESSASNGPVYSEQL